MTRRWVAAALVALAGVPLAACSDDGPGEGEARLEVEGMATVERADGDRETIDGGTDLSAGDRVRVERGVAVMQLAGGTTFELRAGVGEAAPTAVLMAERPVLEAGDLLVSTPGTAKLEADGTDVDVTEGAARVSRAFGMSVAAYDADIALDSAGAAAEVPALRRMAIPALGRPPSAVRPIDYDGQDPWDVRYLGGAIALGDDLERLARDLTGLLPDGEGRSAAFLRLVLPGLEEESQFDDDFIQDTRPPGETFIGAAIADEGERGSFADRWEDVFEFRDQGADWGIVALDQAVESEPLRGSVEQAFNTGFDEIAQGVDEAPSDPGPVDGGTDGGTDGTIDGGGDGGTDGTDGADGGSTPPPTGPTTPPTTPPVTPPTTPEPPSELDPVLGPVVDIVDDLLGGLLG